MAEDRVIEVEPEPIEAPAVLGEAERWLAEQRERVAARRGDFQAHEIASADDYRDSKRQRTALRALIKDVEDGRRSMTRSIDEALARFRDQTKGVLEELTEEEAAYKREISAWEQRVVQDRLTELARRYADEFPDLVAQVPFSRLAERFSAAGKWANYGTGTERAWRSVEEAAQTIAGEVETLRAQEATDDERSELLADYFSGLDMAVALRRAVERRERREAVRRAEEERRAWEAEQAARQAAIDLDAEGGPVSEPREAPAEPAPAPAEAAPASEARPTAVEPESAPQRPATCEATYVFEVRVPESVMPRFLVEMKRLGTHGDLIRKEQ